MKMINYLVLAQLADYCLDLRTVGPDIDYMTILFVFHMFFIHGWPF